MTTIFGQVSAVEGRPLLNLSERIADENEMIRRNNDHLSETIRVSIPATVVSFDPIKNTIVAQPTIREKVIDRSTGNIQWIQLPQILDIPVCYPQGGGVALTFMLFPGDEVLLICADMCMDAWHTSGGIQNWNDRRRHDLSDAFAIPGPSSLPNALGLINPGIEMRTKDGAVRLNISDAGIFLIIGEVTVALADAGSFTIGIGSNKIVMTDSSIDIQGTVLINGHNYLLHTHGGVQAGAGVTTGVIP